MALAESADAAAIGVEVVYCPRPGHCDRIRLHLPATATLTDALRESGMLARHALDASSTPVGVWGRAGQPQDRLREGDRVELYRPLLVDPKEARRQRYKGKRVRQQG